MRADLYTYNQFIADIDEVGYVKLSAFNVRFNVHYFCGEIRIMGVLW